MSGSFYRISNSKLIRHYVCGYNSIAFYLVQFIKIFFLNTLLFNVVSLLLVLAIYQQQNYWKYSNKWAIILKLIICGTEKYGTICDIFQEDYY